MRLRWVFVPLLFAACFLPLLSALAATRSSSLTIPLTFERNEGQAPSPYAYLSRHQGVQALFGRDGADFLVSVRGGNRTLHMRFLHAGDGVQPQARNPLPGHDNYFIGNNPRRWRTGIPTYGEITYPSLYPGIDLLFYGGRGGSALEHDFIVAPGADPGTIRFRLLGADAVRLAPDGNLEVTVAGRQLLFDAPVAWQGTPAPQNVVKAAFRIEPDGAIGFSVPQWDHSRPLTIDPVLVWATYLDGTGSDSIAAIATDSSGNVYVTGTTSSADFPTAAAEQATIAGSQDAFIAKLDPTGHTLLYSTYLGGSNGNQGFSIAVDSNGNVAVSGTSMSQDFPQAGKLSSSITTYTVTYNFIASLTPDGSQLRYSGFIGSSPGSFDDYDPRQNLVAFDSQGNAYLSGLTQQDYPWTSGSFGAPPAAYPANPTMFITKVEDDGTIAWAADVPATSSSEPGSLGIVMGGMAVDSTGAVVVGGTADATLPVTSGVVGPAFPNNAAALYASAGYVLKLNPQGSALMFSTYLPGTDSVQGLTLDSSGNVYASGETLEANLPTAANAYQPSIGQSSTCDCTNGFVLKLSSDGTKALAATYFNGAQASGTASGPATILRDIALDPAGNVAVDGLTGATNLPLVDPLISTFSLSGLPVEDDTLLVARFSSDLSTLQFSSFLNPPDYAASGSAMTTDPQGHILVAGNTESKQFPTTAGAFQPTAPAPPNSYSVLNYQFLASIDTATAAPSLCFDTTAVSFGTILVNTETNATVNITNCGNAALTLTALTSSISFVTATSNCTGVTPNSVCQIQLTYAPTALGSTSGSLSIAGNMGISPQEVWFSGTAGAPLVSLPASISFPNLLVGQTGAEAGLGIYNQGNGPFILTSAGVTGDFSIVSNSCTSPVGPDGSCEIIMNFSPAGSGTRNGTLTLNDNLTTPTQSIPLTGDGLTSAPVPGISSIPAVPQQTSGTGQITVYGTNFFPNSTINWNGSSLATTYEGPDTLVASVPVADLQQVGEASITVSTPAPGGGTSGAAVATIYGALPNITVLNDVYDPATQLLYATVSSTSGNDADSLVAIDPVAMAVVATLLTGNQPDALAISSDNSLLYVGLDGSQSVAQLSLPSGATNFTVKVPGGSDSFLDQYGMMASALAVVPGQPHTWLVGLCYINVGPCGAGVAIFDDSVQRTNEGAGDQLTVNSFAFVNDPTVVYSTEFNQSPANISSYSINSSGITQTATTPFLPAEGGAPLASDGKLLYVANGQVINPSTLNLMFTYPEGGTAFAVDAANRRLFFSGYGAPYYYYGLDLTAVDQSTQAMIGAIQFPVYGEPSDVKRFGTKGIVINNQSGGLIFLQSSLATAPVPSQLVSASPASLAFPLQAVNSTSTGQMLTLTNGGSTTVSVTGISAAGGYAETNTCGSTLAAGASCSISVTFTPTASGDQTGQITITDTGNPATLIVPLDGSGQATLSASATPSTLTFPATVIGTTAAAQAVTLSNTGSEALTISSIGVTGNFTETNNCGASLAPSGSCAISVTFAPMASGPLQGTLTVTDNATAGPQSVNLNGTGATSLTYAAGVSPASLTFAAQAQNTTSSAQTVTLSNTGTGTLTINGIAASGSFAETNTCGSSLAPSASCDIAVTFTPTTTGSSDGTLTITDNAPGSPQTVNLSGNGVTPLSIGAASGGSTSASVSPGQTATYQLSLTGQAGFSGSVSLSCSGAPAEATCSVTPGSVNLTSAGSANFSVSVTTTAASSAALARNSRMRFAGIGLLSLLLLPLCSGVRRRLSGLWLVLALMAAVSFGMVGCGGGGSGGTGGGGSSGTPSGTYTLTVAANSGNTSVQQSLTLVVQ